MSWGYDRWPRYVPAAERRAKAARELAKLAKRSGQTASPVVLEGRKIATTFWGKAWCDNLEAYSDYENRLPRGRTYVRNGSVVDLQISKGKVVARVAGSELYKIEINIKPLAPSLWKSIQAECAGKIDSLIELLQGKLSSAVMQIVTRRDRGLFPTPKEIDLDCSCPDWADLCKHLAAVLYGVGAKLDHNPGLLFLLRGVDPANLITKVSAAEAVRQATATPEGAPAMSEAEVADVFGIELESRSPAAASADDAGPETQIPTPAPTPTSAPKPVRRRQQTTRAKPGVVARARIAAAAKARWAKVKHTDDGVSKAQAKKDTAPKAAPAPRAKASRKP
jgi:uncharacterized Zn finger protein